MNFAVITYSFISQVQKSLVHWHLLHTPRAIDMFFLYRVCEELLLVLLSNLLSYDGVSYNINDFKNFMF